MRRVALDSEAIRTVSYRPRTCDLEITFRETGDVYRYGNVSAAEYAEFLSAESKGTYLNSVFKAKDHPYRLIRRGRN